MNAVLLATLLFSQVPPPADLVQNTNKQTCLCNLNGSGCSCQTANKSQATVTKAKLNQPAKRAVYRTEMQRVCQPGQACYFKTVQVFDHWEEIASKPMATDDAAHTPMAEVVRVLNLLPKPEIGFVDFGCGYDARWCIAAAEKWGCRVTGVEIDPDRAAAARERVRNLGLDHLITIVQGDAETVDVTGDVAVVYLYPDLLARMKPRLEKFRAVASYMHNVSGLPMQQNGLSWIYKKPAIVAATYTATPTQTVQRGAVWGGMVYRSPVCNSPYCSMCNSIRQQLGQ